MILLIDRRVSGKQVLYKSKGNYYYYYYYLLFKGVELLLVIGMNTMSNLCIEISIKMIYYRVRDMVEDIHKRNDNDWKKRR